MSKSILATGNHPTKRTLTRNSHIKRRPTILKKQTPIQIQEIGKETNEPKMHSLRTTTFFQPRFCDACHQFIWGITKQGRECTDCKISLHRQCEPKLPCVESIAKPLNMSRITKNTHKFTLRVSFLRHTERVFLNILMWTDPTVTIIALLTFTLVCFHPILLFLFPNLAVITIAVLSHPKLTGMEPQHTYVIPPKTTPQEYKLNMQHIQNLMGNLSFLIDTIIIQYNDHLAWRNEDHTMKIIQLSVATIPIAIITYLVVPFNIMCLIVGWVVFLSHSPIKEHVNDLIPIVRDIMKPAIKAKDRITISIASSEGLPGDTSSSSMSKSQHSMLLPSQSAAATSDSASATHNKLPPNNTVHLAIYENQRLVEHEYVPTISGNDPPSFSDLQGTIPFPSPSQYKTPPGYTFLNEWHVDSQWAPVDKEGWCLCDDLFNKVDPTLHSTRRRRWTRIVVKDDPIMDGEIKKRISNPTILKSQGSLTDSIADVNSPPLRSSSLYNFKIHDAKSTDEEIIEEIEDDSIQSPTEEVTYVYSYGKGHGEPQMINK